jgi:hypothetical protein
MVTFKMVSSIAYADPIICICFVDGVVPDRRIDLKCLEARYKSGLVGTSIPERSRKRTEVLRRRIGVMNNLQEFKAGIFKLKDLQTSEVNAKLDMPHGHDWRSLMVSKYFVDPLATRVAHLSMRSARNTMGTRGTPE